MSFVLTELPVRNFQSAVQSCWLLLAVSLFQAAHGVNKETMLATCSAATVLAALTS